MKRQTPCIPSLIIPAITRKDDIENRELYSKIISLLFVPFRDLNELIDTNWKMKLQSFLAMNQDNQINHFIDNIEYLKKSISDAENEKRPQTSLNTAIVNISPDDTHVNINHYF
jgi:hypothetical protein